MTTSHLSFTADSTRRFSRRTFGASAGLAALSLAALSACGNDTSALSTNKTDVSGYDAIIAAGPTADAATVDGNAWAKKIKDRGTLNTGGSDSGPLFSIKDPATGKLTGFDAGLAQLLSHYITGKADGPIQLTITTVDTRETLIENGTVDTVVATYSITPARAKKVAFAGPYYRSGDAVMVKSDNTTINSVKDLDGKKVATQQGSTTADRIAKDAPGAKVSLFPDDAQCLAALKTNRVDAYVIDQSILISNASADTTLKVVGEPFSDDYYGIGVTRDDAQAKTFVNDWLTKIEADGTWAKLWKATVGTVVSGEAPTPPKLGSADGS
ncbi:glutamate ABC transporter substrate-binding protein [uncultured Friedmanniella sp.]|uniref:glutamate ABC transporter substrate-binding protein n=1 Tax=uncultured Friedmanniella sp. TaxID=335381 RepID=UPI0035CBF878